MSGPPALVGIVGTGLIGASVGLAAREAGYATVGFDIEPARAAGAARRGALDSVAPSAAELIADAEIVVLAAPLAPTLLLLADFPPAPRSRLVLDVASVKLPVVGAARGVPRFVASHPIAGSERGGPEAARSDLFAGRAWALVPGGDADLLRCAGAFVSSLGARPFSVGAARHDAAIAFTSHLPQVIGTALGAALAERLGEPALIELCGSGIRSTTRLAASPWNVWSGILDANAEAVAQEVRVFAGILRSVADAIEARDGDALAIRFAAAASAAACLEANDLASGPVTPDDTPTRGIV